MNFKSLSFLAIAIVVASTGALAAPVVLSNPYDVNSTTAWQSSSTNGFTFFDGFSDFYYDGSYEITDFHWSGVFNSNDLSGLDGFGFSIYAPDINNPALPGNSVYSQFVTGNASATLNGDFIAPGFAVYDFSLDLTSPWTASVGNYYLNVFGEFAITSNNAFFWGLSQSQYGADDLQWAWGGGSGYTTLTSEGDFAWEITGNPVSAVPEPATMTLFGLGLLGSGLAARRRKRNR